MRNMHIAGLVLMLVARSASGAAWEESFDGKFSKGYFVEPQAKGQGWNHRRINPAKGFSGAAGSVQIVSGPRRRGTGAMKCVNLQGKRMELELVNRDEKDSPRLNQHSWVRVSIMFPENDAPKGGFCIQWHGGGPNAAQGEEYARGPEAAVRISDGSLVYWNNFKASKLAEAGKRREVIVKDIEPGKWQDNWFMDGLKAKVTNGPEGMDFTAGPTALDDSCHAVLWTKQSFVGDLKIEYDYTCLNKDVQFVNIIYIQATGNEKVGKARDIAQWASERRVPSMKCYFNGMDTYHISYAAFDMGSKDPENDYVRMRRYRPDLRQGLNGTDIAPDNYRRTGLFKPAVKHHITIIKQGTRVEMEVRNEQKISRFAWDAKDHPPIDEGRIGLRHMYTRSARYANFNVSVSAADAGE